MIWAAVKALASALGWIGLDLGISYLTGSSDEVEVVYTEGMDFTSFLQGYWPSLVIYGLAVLSVLWFAVPKAKKGGSAE